LAQDVPAIGLGCALPKDGGSGLYLVCDTKYGFRGDKEGLSLNLIRASYDPDPYPEIGRHVIHMAVGACDTDKNTLAMIAEKYFHPVIIRSCTGEPKEEVCKSIFRVEGGILTAAKIAYDENGFILRVYNPSTESTVLKVWMPGRKITVFHCDFLENDLEAVAVSEDDVAEYQLGGGEICSLRLIV